MSKSWQSNSAAAEPIPSQPPLLLLFEVYDVNVWNRQKSVGYGFTHVPLTPGRCSVTVQTWRPHITETSLQLKDFFLGLAPQIENIKYAGLPTDVTNLPKLILTLISKRFDECRTVFSVASHSPPKRRAASKFSLTRWCREGETCWNSSKYVRPSTCTDRRRRALR